MMYNDAAYNIIYIMHEFVMCAVNLQIDVRILLYDTVLNLE